MAWEVEYTDEFGDWWETLTESEQDAVERCVICLEDLGPLLKEPYSKRIESSRHYPDMKELRASSSGNQLRVFYAFDPRRMAVLLVGGDKTGEWEDFYTEMVPVADALYDEHLKSIQTK